MHYFVIWHDFSDVQCLKSEVSAWKHLFSWFQLVFPSQSAQWPTTRSWIFKILGIYFEIFQTWTSRQKNEVLNIVQAKKYPEVPTFWRLFHRPKMAEISNLLSHFSAMCDNTWVKSAEGHNPLGAFERALCWSHYFVFSKWLLLKGIWL